MDHYNNFISVFIAGFCAVLSWFFGNFDGSIKILVACVVADYITGISAAYVQGNFENSICFKGIGKKVIMFVLVGLTQVTGRELLGNPGLRDIVIYFYVANEGLSIIKNADEVGVPVPKILIKGFSSLKEKQLVKDK